MQFTLNTSSLPESGLVKVEGDTWFNVAQGQVDRVTKLYLQSLVGEDPVGNFLLQFLAIDNDIKFVSLFREVLAITGIEGEWVDNEWYKRANEPVLKFNEIEYIGSTQELQEYNETIAFFDDTVESVQAQCRFFERDVEGQRERFFTSFEIAPNYEKMLQFWIGYDLPVSAFQILTPILPDVETEYVDAGTDAEVGESESENGSEPESESAE